MVEHSVDTVKLCMKNCIFLFSGIINIVTENFAKYKNNVIMCKSELQV